MNLVLSPHNDDSELFAAFTIIRESAHVVVCYRGAHGYGDPDQRENESRLAVHALGGTVEQWAVSPGDAAWLHAAMAAFSVRLDAGSRVWAPDEFASHPDHVMVARVAADVFRGRLTTYHTYYQDPAKGVDLQRVVSDRPVHYEPEWVYQKLKALACYRTQATHPRAGQFFMQTQHEYYGKDL